MSNPFSGFNMNNIEEPKEYKLPTRVVSHDDMIIRMTTEEVYKLKLKEALNSKEDAIIFMPLETYESLYLKGFINSDKIGGRQINVLDERYNPFDGEIIPYKN